MDSATYKEHENCIRKMIIIIDLTHRNLRFILRHISKDDPSIFHDVDEFAVTAPITLTPTWLAKEATRIGDENARSKERPYSNVEIHIEKGFGSDQDVVYARDRLYRNGWHSIDEECLKFVSHYNTKENENDNTSD